MRLGKASVGAKVGGSHHTACGQLGTMNPVIAGKRLRYLGSRFDCSFRIRIQRQMAPGSRQAGGTDEAPNLTASCRNEPRQLFRPHATSNYRCAHGFQIFQPEVAQHDICQVKTITMVSD